MVVHHLNLNNIYHRDLKPQNFLVIKEPYDKTYLHLNDFGFAKNTKPDYDRISSLLGDTKGTIEYLAPEILDSQEKKPDITKQDVWSIGVIAY
jgi:serine/threonine protein kinase